jgi:glycosyltransferase involved in cell wall biosynthesis
MKVLAVVPLPPPITGHSLLSNLLVDGLRKVHETAVVNLSIGSLNDGRVTRRRIREVGKVLAAVWRQRRWADVMYLTISESRAGNLKDMMIYLILAGRLERLFVHLHGGTIGRELFDRHPFWRAVNALFIRRLRGVIISGPAHLEIFERMIDRGRIHLVPNCAEDEMFIDEAGAEEKFLDTRPLRVLYLSTMTPEKGYLDLVDAWQGLDDDGRRRVQLDLAGRFEREGDRAAFEDRIAGIAGIRYHGLVSPAEKRRLFAAAHVFCLPTRMFEGQPISVLEAYASGCVVITTGQRGIRDVFADGVNGFEAAAGSPPSIAAALRRAVDDPGCLKAMAITNRRTAGERYRTSTFTAALRRVLEAGAPGASLPCP